MKHELKETISNVVKERLDQAEAVWAEAGGKLVERALIEKSATQMFSMSEIPGHPIVGQGSTVVDEFIAVMADMRDSTKHLLELRGKHGVDVQQLQRVYYETAALIPALALSMYEHQGRVTEYLGDGILALFKYSEDDPQSLYNAYWAASDCITATIDIVNPELETRYKLPPLSIGVGIAKSKALVNLVGTEQYWQAKVFGECVYRASKTSKGVNQIGVDPKMRYLWPKGDKGVVKFNAHVFKGGFEGFIVERG